MEPAITGAQAELVDEDHTYTFRRTPEGQATVADLVRRGMTIRSSYDTGGIVVEVRGPFVDNQPFSESKYPPTYTIVYVHADDWQLTPKQQESHYCWINELVAVDGRLLKLFDANTDEVFISAPERAPENRAGQLGLF